MPALDRHHHAVRNALVKDGWTITHDPLTLTVDEDQVLVDLGAERIMAAEKGTRRIAVEIKTFAGPSPIADLEKAVGQYVIYGIALSELDPDRQLYLAVPQQVVEVRFAKRGLWKGFFNRVDGKIVGYDVEREEITQWMP
jgi:hypothetical protein